MQTLLKILAGVGVFALYVTVIFSLWLLGVGVAMVVIGAVGHWFDITTFQFLSFWEVFILSIIMSVFGLAGK